MIKHWDQQWDPANQKVKKNKATSTDKWSICNVRQASELKLDRKAMWSGLSHKFFAIVAIKV
jgi:hypothetical protein